MEVIVKVCVLKYMLVEDPTYDHHSRYLYILPIDEYKKQILKGNVYTDTNLLARVCASYARNILKGRFELGEDYISKDSYFGYSYARHVLKGRFKLCEETISKDYTTSYLYTVHVLRERFILGEAIIKDSPYRRL